MGVIPMGGLSNVTPAKAQRLQLGSWRGSLVTFLETLRLAVDSLRAHKLRSFLTLLGVILAVAVLVVVMSFVAGMNVYVADKIANLGANVFIVDRFGIITSNDAWVKAQKRPLVTMEEFERLKENMKTAKAIAALDDHNIDIRSGNEKMTGTDVMGVSPNYADVRSITIAQGRFVTQSDDDHRAEVVVIGADVAAKLFPNVDPIGKAIRAETHEYQVIGVAAAIGSAFGQSQDNFMIMPIHTFARELHRQRDWIAIFVQAPSAEMMEATQDEARMLMRAWRHLPYDAPDNFALLGSDSIMKLWHDLTGTLAGAAVGIVSIFMVVGGIVIMNIMLASVTERTREIGIRRSLGARKKHILLQFMTESGMLAAMGGVIGLVTAYAFVLLIRALTFIPVEMQTSAIVISLVISTLIGLFFGIFPAMRAAKLDPIEALRADG
ncbi:MAG: ABC transporter permease [Acidobacteria bacterium]|nr:ABC transporter permease [Acidobacteriota bacterium]MBS1864699.1 ABC transporter permease [Acidobacteriota bacterium]